MANNSGKQWTQEDDDRLVAMLQLDIPLRKIAEDLGRTEGAVLSRMESMMYSIQKFSIAKSVIVRG